MTEPSVSKELVYPARSRELDADRQISFLDLVNLLLRSRWRIVRWMLICSALAVVPLLFRKTTYTSRASFAPQGTDLGRSGLASLAGQFGVAVPAPGQPSQSPQFYADLLRTREVLGQIVDDSFDVQGVGGERVSLPDLFGVGGDSPEVRRDNAIRLLTVSIVEADLSKATGVVTISVTTQWPAVSIAIAQRLLDGVNRFTLRTRQSQGAAERRFTEERLAEGRDSLRTAEDRLERFLKSNRRYQDSPELTFEHDRIQRDVQLQQQIVTSLNQAYEEARVREVRDTPVITVVDAPALPTLPNPRGRLRRAAIGMMFGALFGALLAIGGDALARRRGFGDPQADAFTRLLREVRSDLTRWIPGRLGGRKGDTVG